MASSSTSEIGSHPKQNLPTQRFFWCLNTAWGTVELAADRVALSVLYGPIVIQRFNSALLQDRNVAHVSRNCRALRHAARDGLVILAEPAHLEAGAALRIESGATN